MRKQKTRILIFFIIGLSIHITKCYGQQIPSWSSFYENAFIWNPALTAQWYHLEVNATHRQEWVGFDGAPQTSTISFQIPITGSYFQSKTSVGFFMEQDRVGPYSSKNISGTYSYKVIPKLFGNKKDLLSFGVQGSFQYRSFDTQNSIAFEGISNDPAIDAAPGGVAPNFSMGVFYRSNQYLYRDQDHYYFGLSINRSLPYAITSSGFSSLGKNLYSTFHAGFRKFPRGDGFIEPSIVVNYASLKAVNVMASLRLEDPDALWITGGLVSNGEVFGQGGVIFNRRSVLGSLVGDGLLRLGVKVDYSLGSLRRFGGIGYSFYMAYQYDVE